jgi:5-methylcytosine-specific restriction endonuclease McrA
MCEVLGCNSIGDEVDHIIELSDDGDALDWSNLQTLCDRHHSKKTAAHAVHKRRGHA